MAHFISVCSKARKITSNLHLTAQRFMTIRKEVEDISVLKQRRKGKTLIQNLFAKMTDELGDFPSEDMMCDELLKMDDADFDSLLEDKKKI
jgi:hypothetical protein